MEGCVHVASLSGLYPPLGGLHVVLLRAFAICVHKGNGILGRNITLFRRLQGVLERECGIFANGLFGRQVLSQKVGSAFAKQRQWIVISAGCRRSRAGIVILSISSSLGARFIQPLLPAAFGSLPFRAAEVTPKFRVTDRRQSVGGHCPELFVLVLEQSDQSLKQ